jgi:hypothetical protein
MKCSKNLYVNFLIFYNDRLNVFRRYCRSRNSRTRRDAGVGMYHAYYEAAGQRKITTFDGQREVPIRKRRTPLQVYNSRYNMCNIFKAYSYTLPCSVSMNRDFVKTEGSPIFG